MRFIRWFEDLSLADVASVGGKIASLGELLRELTPLGVRVPGGFAVTADGYRHFAQGAALAQVIREQLSGSAPAEVAGVDAQAARVRAAIEAAPLPADLEAELRAAYRTLSERAGAGDADVAVRPSAIADELPASSTELAHCALNVRGEEGLLVSVRGAFASLFSAHATSQRQAAGLDHRDAALAVGVQKMVRADLASSGCLSTRDAASGHDGVITIGARFGLGEAAVEPDQLLLHKATLLQGYASLVQKSIARKQSRLVYAAGGASVEREEVPLAEQRRPSISDAEALQLARWALSIEDHFARRSGRRAPVSLEWAKDGLTGELYVLRARPQAPQSAAGQTSAGAPSGPRPRTQMMLNLADPDQALALAQLPNDGVGLLRLEQLFARTVGIHPLALTRFAALPHQLMVQVDRATGGHPDKPDYFVDKLAQGIGVIAAAFHPRPVLLRLSDLKSNEYASLIGGAGLEPHEDNPLLGLHGASRYLHPDYKDCFLLEAAAIRRVREQFGLTNLQLLVPFCRTPDEGRRVLELLAEAGLISGKEGLDIHAMAELPANVLMADELAQIFDGFSIGAADLTQLMLGADGGNPRVAEVLDQGGPALREACALLVQAAHRYGKPVGISGQAVADFPELATFLVEQGIDSISLDQPALEKTTEQVLAAEKLGLKRRSADRSKGQVLRLERRRRQDRRTDAASVQSGAAALSLAPAPPAHAPHGATALAPEGTLGMLALAEAAAACASAPAAAGEPADTLALLLDEEPQATD